MKFCGLPVNRLTRVLAALVLIGFGTEMLIWQAMPIALPGAAITTIGICVLFNEGRTFLSERWARRDKYSLRLIDTTSPYSGPSRDDPARAADSPTWESEEGDAIYCHRCDISMPATYSICPRCGARIG